MGLRRELVDGSMPRLEKEEDGRGRGDAAAYIIYELRTSYIYAIICDIYMIRVNTTSPSSYDVRFSSTAS